MSKLSSQNISCLVTAAVFASGLGIGAANASDNPFSSSVVTEFQYQVAGGEGKCGEGKCGEGKCGAGDEGPVEGEEGYVPPAT